MRRFMALTLAVIAMTSVTTAAAADSVPIKRGYYVESDTPCQHASNSSITLYDGRSFGSAHVQCRRPSIKKLADGSYQIAEQCRDTEGRGGPWEPLTSKYVVLSPTEFTLTNSLGKETYRFRHCAQADMPDPWSTNDLRSIGVK
jgi:hypothetical protein